MLRNHLLVAWRNLLRHRGYAAISIASLALSLSVCLLLVVILHHQGRYDRHLPAADRTYRVLSDPGGSREYASSPAPLGPALAERFAGVEAYSRVYGLGGHVLVGGSGVEVRGYYVEPAFLDLFGWSVRPGGTAAALAEPYRVLLTEEAARRVFGERDPVGLPLEVQDVGTFTVAGLLGPPAGPSHLQPEALASFATVEAQRSEQVASWQGSLWTYHTYLRLSPSVPPAALEPAFATLRAEHFPDAEAGTYTFRLQRVTDIALGPVVNNEASHHTLPGVVALILALLVGVILLAVCFSFANLSLARAFERVREVGVRKTLGARRAEVAAQFLVEAVVLAMLALAVAVLLLPTLRAAFNGLYAVREVGWGVPEGVPAPGVLLAFVGIALVVGVLAGAYPALALSSPQPVSVLNRQRPALGGRGRMRRVLLGAQFFLSFVLLVSTLLLYRQGAFMTDGDYRFDTDRLLYVESRGASFDALAQEVAALAGVEAVAGVSHLPIDDARSTGDFQAEGREEPLEFRLDEAGEAVLDALGVPLVAGALPPSTGGREQILINETAARRLGAAAPAEAVGLTLLRGGAEHRVAGVVADFHTDSFAQAIQPLALFLSPDPQLYLLVRADPAHHEGILTHLAERWPTLDPVHALEAGTLVGVIRDRVGPLRDLMGLVGVTAAFTLLIVGMGLLGVAAYSMQVRAREVGIRRALGASVSGLALLLSREFLWLAGVALALGLPTSWALNRLWLDLFAYRVEVGAGVFVGPAVVLGAVLLASVGAQALRAATADPVRALRSE